MMPISEARKRANDKWREKFEELRFRVPKEKKQIFQEHAAKNGESVNAVLNRAVEETMARDEKK